MIIIVVSKGFRELLKLLLIWKIDCVRLCCLLEVIWVMWEDFGWKIDELVLISVVVSRIVLKLFVSVSSIRLFKVKYMLIGNDYGIGYLLV